MTSLLTDTTRSLAQTSVTRPLSSGLAIAVMVLLLVLLIVREVARPLLSGEQAARVERLGFLAFPLALIVAVLIASRVAEILR
jgi:hypothetical protein